MTNSEAIKILQFNAELADPELKDALILAISALKMQEQSCDTCKHGRFGDKACINCHVGFPNQYEAEEDND